MIVPITKNDCCITDPEDCGRLHATAEGLTDIEAGTALQRAGLGGAGEPEHVWLAVDALGVAARAGTETFDWGARFEAMIAYAGSNGWLDASGQHVAAHIDRAAARVPLRTPDLHQQ